MKTLLPNTLILLFLCLVISAEASQTSFTHTQTYKWNKEIWGTYNLHKEDITYKKDKKTWTKKVPFKMGDIVFQGKNMILIKENKLLPNQSDITSKSFRYIKGMDKKITVTDKLKKQKLASLFTHDIHKNLKESEYRDGHVTYNDFRCSRTKKNTLTCTIKGHIKEKANQVTLK